MKQTTQIKVTINDSILEIAFSHGKKLIVDSSEFSKEIQDHALMHGLKQKLIDAAAINRDVVTGKPASIETKYQAIKELYERLLEGNWNKERIGGFGQTSVLAQALFQYYKERKTMEEIKTGLDSLSNKEKLAMKVNPKIKVIIDEIENSKLSRLDVDSDSLLDSFGDELDELDE